MYSKVTNPIVEVYDAETNKYLGKARFDMTQEVEKALLDLLNYGMVPNSMVLRNFKILDSIAFV